MISPARKIAYEVLRRVEAEGAFASDLLHTELGARIKPEDAGLATELVMGVLRWRRLLDFLLEQHLKKPVAKLDLPVALALRIGLYQLRFLQRIPPSAAVNESVELVKIARKTSAATLVNAVLRRAANEARVPAEKFLPQATPLAERLSILHSHPTWLVDRWLAARGEAANNRPARSKQSRPAPNLRAARPKAPNRNLHRAKARRPPHRTRKYSAIRLCRKRWQSHAHRILPLRRNFHSG